MKPVNWPALLVCKRKVRVVQQLGVFISRCCCDAVFPSEMEKRHDQESLLKVSGEAQFSPQLHACRHEPTINFWPKTVFCLPQSAALLFSACWLFTNVVVLNLVIALVLERFRLKDSAKLGIQRKEVLKAARTTHVS